MVLLKLFQLWLLGTLLIDLGGPWGLQPVLTFGVLISFSSPPAPETRQAPWYSLKPRQAPWYSLISATCTRAPSTGMEAATLPFSRKL